MANYVIGDIQGCFHTLKLLLRKLKFSEQNDTLWLLGDLVNRGRHSLDVLRYLSGLPHCHTVLGNHDLHLLAVAYNIRSLREGDTLTEVLQAPDRDALLSWLMQQVFYLSLPQSHIFLIHAGILPNYDYAHITEKLDEAQQALIDAPKDFLHAVFSEEDQETVAWVANAVTRLRFCHQDGAPDWLFKGDLATGEKKGLIPWYNCLHPSWNNKKIIFGHWAALQGAVNNDQLLALDTGCVWGRSLSAYCVETAQITSIKVNADDIQ